MIFRKYIYLVLLIIAIPAILESCATHKLSMTYSYTDQNNNQYGISVSEIKYRPIEPSESSSGYYDGGEKITMKITVETFNKISNQADAILLASESFASARRMRTAILSRTKNGETKKVIINTSEKRTAFELLLKQTLH